MALYVKVSNSLESLSLHLAETLKASGTGVFEPYLVVTQTEGMNNWLKQQLAAHIGIAANCRFMKPNDLVYQLYYLLGGAYTETLSAQNLTWLLYNLLGEKEFNKKFPSVAAYYQEAGADKDLRRMALAEKAADLFDQYQVYRPEMIREWNKATPAATGKDEWQQYLWIKVKQISGNTLPDKTEMGQYILEALQHKEHLDALQYRMRSVHLFGLSIITAYHVQILFRLSAFTDVHFHIINPAPGVYWFDDRTEKQLARWRQKGRAAIIDEQAGNPLLTGWGRVVQDTFGLFFNYDAFMDAYDDSDVVEPVPDSLLHKIQHDIFNAATTDRNHLTPVDIQDGTVTFNSCYTVAREVEVLYNYLVHLVDKKQEKLSSRDIVVMVSNIDQYAPYIKAVFNNAPYRFRYTIADESYADSDNLFNALHSVLKMTGDSFKAEEVLQLLDASCIRKRFGITDLPLIRKVVDYANIRYGIAGRQEDETFIVSWRYGLKRIMYGICMSGEEEYGEGVESFYPLDMLEGSTTWEIIRFCHFVEVLIDAVEERRRDRTIAGWVSYVESVLHQLVYEPEEDADEDYNTIMQRLADYNVLNVYMSDTVSFEVFGHSFLQTLTSTTRSGLFVNGGITFCSLIPMRSIPFKVVALLGLGYDKFPRREQAPGFNLMEQHRQRGDRNVKENDKHLFLETILSAREYLYISYVGQSARDNTTIPPSALVDELIDYIETGAEEPQSVRQRLVTRQPLQGFSPRYSQGDEQLYSYLGVTSAAKRGVIKSDKDKEPFVFEEISLDDLVSFFKNPFKTYYNKVLGIYYREDQVLLSDTEIFRLDTLQQWNLKNQLLPMDAEELDTLKKRLVKTGTLPLKNMADVTVLEVEDKVQAVRQLYKACTGEAVAQVVTIEITVAGSLLKGMLRNVFDGRLVHISWSRNERKYLLEAYLRYLAGVASGSVSAVCFISGARENASYEGVPLTQQEAMDRLTGLVQIYKAGFERMTPFYPDFDISPHAVEELAWEAFVKMVKETLDGYFKHNDPYIVPEYERGFFNRPEILEEWRAVSRQMIVPLASLFPGYPFKK